MNTPYQQPIDRNQGAPAPQVMSVIVRDVEMPFGSMIVFMLKWALASIPAAILLSIVVGGLGVIGMMFLTALGLAAGSSH